MTLGKKKKPTKEVKVSTHFIMTVIMPCVMLACKDKYDTSPEELHDLSKRINRYIAFIADGSVTVKELNALMAVDNISQVKQTL